jgi:hypothetical protein
VHWSDEDEAEILSRIRALGQLEVRGKFWGVLYPFNDARYACACAECLTPDDDNHSRIGHYLAGGAA